VTSHSQALCVCLGNSRDFGKNVVSIYFWITLEVVRHTADDAVCSPFLMGGRRTLRRDKVLVFSLSHLCAGCGLSQKMRLNWRGWCLFFAVLLAMFQIRCRRTCNVRLSYSATVFRGPNCHVRHLFGQNSIAHLQLS